MLWHLSEAAFFHSALSGSIWYHVALLVHAQPLFAFSLSTMTHWPSVTTITHYCKLKANKRPTYTLNSSNTCKWNNHATQDNSLTPSWQKNSILGKTPEKCKMGKIEILWYRCQTSSNFIFVTSHFVKFYAGLVLISSFFSLSKFWNRKKYF